MSKTQEIIKVLNNVFGNAELPLCISVLDGEGMEIFATRTCQQESYDESTNVLGQTML